MNKAPGSEAEKYQFLAGYILSRAIRARTNLVEFFEFVMREEHKRLPLEMQPHQIVVLKFVMDHDRAVLMLPIGTSKTFLMAGLSMFLMGQDVTLRGAIISATQGQAAKPLGMVKDYIDTSAELKLVFPHLKRATPWTDTRMTVERPPGIRDPSMVAFGHEGAIPGARLNWIIVDDILNHENTASKEQRDKVYGWFDSSVLSRLDPRSDARVVITNTAWHPNDMPHRMRDEILWPTLRMDVEGGIQIHNTGDGDCAAGDYPPGDDRRHKKPWDCEELKGDPNRPWDPSACRLAAHDDPKWDKYREGGLVPLWPQRYDWDLIKRKKREHHPARFNQLFMNLCRDDATSMFKLEWFEKCKMLGRGLSLVSQYDGSNMTFTGVDLAIDEGEEHDDTAFFTFEALPNGMKRILDIEIGQMDGPTILKKIKEKTRQFKSFVTVENNSAQDFIRQFALADDAGLMIEGFTTGRAKAHPEYGVAGLSIELHNAAWIIPCDHSMRCHPSVQRWIDGCLHYTPTGHTEDILMACYFAREQSKKFGVPTGPDTANINSSVDLHALLTR